MTPWIVRDTARGLRVREASQGSFSLVWKARCVDWKNCYDSRKLMMSLYLTYMLRRVFVGLLASIVFMLLMFLFMFFTSYMMRENPSVSKYLYNFPDLVFKSAPYWIALAVLIPLCRDWLGPKPRRINPRLLAENARGITLQDCFRIRKFNDALDRSRYGEGA